MTGSNARSRISSFAVAPAQRKRGSIALAILLVASFASTGAPAQGRKARNVILLLGDAGGLSTLHAAGILAHDKPLSLYIQSMPHIALADTSSLNRWVSDSAAGMTAIVAGSKTNNGMLSVVPSAGGTDFTSLTTILEHAERRGLSTGVVTNKAIWDATPAACYAHVTARSSKDEIFQQLLAPRYGNGVDIVVGKGLKDAQVAYAKTGRTTEQAFAAAGYRFGTDPAILSTGAGRTAVLRDDDYAAIPSVEAAIGSLASNRKGYFLMVEWDMHTDDPRKGMRNAIEMDALARRIGTIAGKDTLVLFVADHSFGLRLRGGERATPFAQQYEASLTTATSHEQNPIISVLDDHTGEEVVAAAMGPGAEQVRGFLPNTRLFEIMMSAFGWRRD